ncbi:hypothetical protein [Chamaesiphon sp. VAR_48_metabat_403]|uniref:hypothetical protein n=1 Tax=Chamaesiphon sp. VAR_48_metabat_403 TaxID=2964700 RepID=UPI00286DEA77|nr:hypothetical protein [Chamaesiphon sp. VAR_48_metabat_403]
MKSVSIAKLARFSAMCVACAIVVTNINPSFAQSTDRDNPTPLTTNILSNPGKQNSKTVYYYSLTAKPGQITITLDSDVGSVGGSSSTTVRIQTIDGNNLKTISASSNSGNPKRQVDNIKFTSEIPVLLLISSSGYHKIKIDGDWARSGSASTPTKPESKPDNPVTTVPKPIAPTDPNTCKQGYVWREAMPNDVVCVTPKVRTRTRQENSQASLRREPNGGAYGADTCKQGFVWREATSADRVCVVPKIRAEAAEDNKQAGARRIVP